MSSYDDIINLPHHVSPTRKPMSMEARAAQFAPFAALTGHDEAISETARITDCITELSQDERNNLNLRLSMALGLPEAQITITHFIPDATKAGGRYIKTCGQIKRIDELENVILLQSGEKIPLASIKSLEGEIFKDLLD